MLDTYAGKTLEEVKEMDPLGADAVSGATMAGAAIHEAVINALEGKAGKTFLPGTGNVLPVEEIKENQVIMNSQLPEDFDVQILDIRYGVYNAEEDIVPAEEYTAEVVDNQVVLTFQDLAGMKPGKILCEYCGWKRQIPFSEFREGTRRGGRIPGTVLCH